MSHRIPISLAAALSLAPIVAVCANVVSAQTSPFAIELEVGPAWQSYNDVEIPNDGSATRFSLYDVVGSGPWLAARIDARWNFAERHSLRLVLAPFSLTESGSVSEPVDFAGEGYAPGPVTATYTFNSYRIGYSYRIHRGERTRAWVGFTAKMRDATIALEQGSTTSRKDDVGFVPLLRLAGDWRWSPSWLLALEADGLAGGPGRAIDAELSLAYDRGGPWSGAIGYRVVEGGADVTEVYNFAWLNYATVSLTWRW